MSDGHAPLLTGYVSGDPEPGWRFKPAGRTMDNHYARTLMDGPRFLGRVEVQAQGGGWAWRHVPSSGPATPWVGCAPTGQQAKLDADQHARRCPL